MKNNTPTFFCENKTKTSKKKVVNSKKSRLALNGLKRQKVFLSVPPGFFGKVLGLNVVPVNFSVVLDFRIFRHFRQVVFSRVHQLSPFFTKLTTIFRPPCIAGLA